MAKTTVTCLCSKCGATFEKSTKKQTRREADEWEQWAQDNYTLCPSCWGKAKIEWQILRAQG